MRTERPGFLPRLIGPLAATDGQIATDTDLGTALAGWLAEVSAEAALAAPSPGAGTSPDQATPRRPRTVRAAIAEPSS